MRKPRKYLTDETRDQIVLEVVAYGYKKSAVAERIGLSPSSVSVTMSIYQYVKDEDWDNLRRMAQYGSAKMDTVRWAEKKLSKTVPQDVVDLQEAYVKSLRKQRPAVAVVEQPSEVTQQPERPVPDQGGAYLIAILNGLAAIRDSLEEIKTALRSERDYSILMQSINNNSDVLNHTLTESLDCLRGIKMNTRRKGQL